MPAQALNVGAETSVVGLMYGARPSGSGVDMGAFTSLRGDALRQVRKSAAARERRRYGGGFLTPAALAHLSHHQAPSVQKPCRPHTPEPQVPQVIDGVQSRAARPLLTPPHSLHSPAARLTCS